MRSHVRPNLPLSNPLPTSFQLLPTLLPTYSLLPPSNPLPTSFLFPHLLPTHSLPLSTHSLPLFLPPLSHPRPTSFSYQPLPPSSGCCRCSLMPFEGSSWESEKGWEEAGWFGSGLRGGEREWTEVESGLGGRTFSKPLNPSLFFIPVGGTGATCWTPLNEGTKRRKSIRALGSKKAEVQETSTH